MEGRRPPLYIYRITFIGLLVNTYIFENALYFEKIPDGYHAVHLTLDATVRSDLNWEEIRQKARTYINEGFKIFWEIDLGLFSKLPHSLSHQTQFLSLCLSMDHFRDVIWKEFQDHSIGVCLYKGPLDFMPAFPWDEQQDENLKGWLEDANIETSTYKKEELITTKTGRRLLQLFCSDACTNLLNLLAARVPEEIPYFACLDPKSIDDLEILAQLTSKERFGSIRQIIRNPVFFHDDLYWNEGSSGTGILGNSLPPACSDNAPTIGVCLPPITSVSEQLTAGLAEKMQTYIDQNVKVKIIAEENLVSEWDGLDEIVVCSAGVSPTGRRKLQGFLAAGGVVTEVDIYRT